MAAVADALQWEMGVHDCCAVAVGHLPAAVLPMLRLGEDLIVILN